MGGGQGGQLSMAMTHGVVLACLAASTVPRIVAPCLSRTYLVSEASWSMRQGCASMANNSSRRGASLGANWLPFANGMTWVLRDSGLTQLSTPLVAPVAQCSC